MGSLKNNEETSKVCVLTPAFLALPALHALGIISIPTTDWSVVQGYLVSFANEGKTDRHAATVTVESVLLTS
ncbi:uncharacterized protein BDW70DRAFT_142302 [Aspergillus foveolatus]|uniref:uncharacterized protein n=1 Tax=Aspergillus foveolatus TaxID=210207 RepID=UPI003CCD25A9